MKKAILIKTDSDSHWVGDGFPVRNVFSYHDIAEAMSPFLLMDYAGPKDFPPTEEKKGVGEHPHRGFETVTIVFHGEVEHRDSTGAGGKIGPGDVQWMTAASGIVHEEFHGREYARRGGRFELIQLWVNLRAKDKMMKPGYQGILNSEIPEVELPDQAGKVRIIAGEYQKSKGPAVTQSPMNLWTMKLKAGKSVKLDLPEGHSTALFLMDGHLKFAGGELGDVELALFEREGTQLSFEVVKDSSVLFLGGEPLNEPIVGYGPFVMNTEEEIRKAYSDYRSGKMGHLGA